MWRVRTFRDLIVWQRAIELCLDVYRVTESFPANERFGMTSELRKTVRSVAYNIAKATAAKARWSTSDSSTSREVRPRS